jgi:hypothetical protein
MALTRLDEGCSILTERSNWLLFWQRSKLQLRSLLLQRRFSNPTPSFLKTSDRAKFFRFRSSFYFALFGCLITTSFNSNSVIVFPLATIEHPSMGAFLLVWQSDRYLLFV